MCREKAWKEVQTEKIRRLDRSAVNPGKGKTEVVLLFLASSIDWGCNRHVK